MKTAIFCAFIFGALVGASVADFTNPAGWPEDAGGCTTDSDCFLKCQRDLKRPCTDDDVFGPPYTLGARE